MPEGETRLMPSVNVVNGKQIVVETLDPLQRVQRFLAKPFLQMRNHQDLILAILRRELRARFQGSAGGWIWAVFAPLMAFRSPMLLHEYAHYIKQTIFPSDMLAVISTLRATAYIGISVGVLLLLELIVRGGLPWTVVLLPLVFLPLMAFLVGMAWFLCAVG